MASSLEEELAETKEIWALHDAELESLRDEQTLIDGLLANGKTARERYVELRIKWLEKTLTKLREKVSGLQRSVDHENKLRRT